MSPLAIAVLIIFGIPAAAVVAGVIGGLFARNKPPEPPDPNAIHIVCRGLYGTSPQSEITGGFALFCEQHPNAKEIYKTTDKYSREYSEKIRKERENSYLSYYAKQNNSENCTVDRVPTSTFVKDMMNLGAKAVMTDSDIAMVFTEYMAYVCLSGYAQTFVFPAPNRSRFMSHIHKEEIEDVFYVNVTKKRSVVGGAIAGGIVAGAAGAVVGAITANNAQPKTKVYEHKLGGTGKFRTSFEFGHFVRFFDNYTAKICTADDITVEGADTYSKIYNLLDKIW